MKSSKTSPRPRDPSTSCLSSIRIGPILSTEYVAAMAERQPHTPLNLAACSRVCKLPRMAIPRVTVSKDRDDKILSHHIPPTLLRYEKATGVLPAAVACRPRDRALLCPLPAPPTLASIRPPGCPGGAGGGAHRVGSAVPPGNGQRHSGEPSECRFGQGAFIRRSIHDSPMYPRSFSFSEFLSTWQAQTREEQKQRGRRLQSSGRTLRLSGPVPCIGVLAAGHNRRPFHYRVQQSGSEEISGLS